MKELISKFEAVWVSVTFAEAGEYVISQQIMTEDVYRAENAEPCQAV